MAKVRRKPPAPLRPFYDEEGYVKRSPFLDKLTDYNPFIVHPTQACEQKGTWKTFTKDKPLAVEIGSGQGFFVTEMAQRHPEWSFLGLELKLRRLFAVVKKIARAELDNAHACRFDGDYLDWLFGTEEIDHLYVMFPDPWAKRERHRYRRLITTDFVEKMAVMVAPGGTIEFKTDHLEYFEEACDLLNTAPFTVDRQTNTWLDSPWADEMPLTLFERNFAKRGIQGRYLRAVKKA